MRCYFGVVFLLALGAVQGQLQLSILHFNDFHARFEPISSGGGTCQPGDNEACRCFGGIARIYSAIAERRSTMTNPIVLNAGDNFQGTLMYSLFKWNITLEFMKEFNFDAMAFGNHEFDDKIAGIVPFVEELGSPMVAANMDASEEPTLDGKYSSSVTITRDGKQIGIIGCISKYTPAMSSPEKVKFVDEIPAIRAEVEILKGQGVDIFILLSHSGYDVDLEMAQQIPDLDIIVGSHTHTFLYTGDPPSTDVPEGEYPTVVTSGNHKSLIVQAMAFTKYLGVLEVEFDAAGEATSWSGNPVLMDSTVDEDSSMVTLLEPWVEEANVIGQEVIGTTLVFLDSSTCYDQECNLGSFLTDAMVHENSLLTTIDEGWTKAAIAIMNPGGIRAPIGETSNDITYNDLITAQPFQNTIDTIELQGKDIAELMEQAASRPVFNGRKLRFSDGEGCFQVSGIQATYNLDNAHGSRLVDLKLRCAKCRIPEFFPVDREAWYTVAMPSFLSGGAAFPLIPERGKNLTVGRVDNEVVKDYITKESPILAGVEGRISLTSASPILAPSILITVLISILTCMQGNI